ncbi:palmitoyltransferase ZDHHC23 isoform X3 [Passer domesticus]|uniref:palmitoyltransferase ZDHHC23 isoform X3 n=1 Tax=Passer domesticus TaxID=48849 RepID=UPI0030FF026E
MAGGRCGGGGPAGGGGGARGAPEAAAAAAGAAPGPAGGTGGRRRWRRRSAAASTWTGAAGATTWRRAAATARSSTTAATALSRAKKDPGYLPISAGNEEPSHQGLHNRSIRGSSGGLHGISGAASSRAVNGEAKGYCRMSAQQPAGVKRDWCTKCQLVRPARAGHCRLCGRCVRRLDHHCVWINSCVGEQNHQAFILALSFFMLTSVYGITLTLHTICRGRSPFVALFYCPGAYSDYSSALSFTCVWYCAIVTAGMGYILLIQLLNISYNVTEREARLALRDNTGRRLLALCRGHRVTSLFLQMALCHGSLTLFSRGAAPPTRTPLHTTLPRGHYVGYPLTDNSKYFPWWNGSSHAVSQQ